MPSDQTAQYLRDILDEIARIDHFLKGMTFADYQADEKTTYAVERSLHIVTEAGFRLGDDAERLCPEPDWRNLRSLGNFLRHSYDRVSDRIIWDAVEVDLPPLKASVTAALAQISASLKRLGILLSGRGSNFVAIQEAIAKGRLPGCEIAIVLSNNADAPGLARARELGLPAQNVPGTGPDGVKLSPAERDREFIARLREQEVDLVCLAGYMRIISPEFVTAFPDRILNVHPSLLPSFPGLDAQGQAIAFGTKVAGCTVHFVDEHVDHGVIVLQRAVPVLDEDTAETLAARILVEEHTAYPEAIARVLSGDSVTEGRRYIRRR